MPNRRCAAKTCFNTQNCRPNLKFFESPKDDDSYRQWAVNSGRLDLLEQRSKFVLCADHFEEACFLNPKFRTTFIRGGSIPVPSIFRNNFADFVPSVLQKSANGLRGTADPSLSCLDERATCDPSTLLVADDVERDNLEQESQKLCRLCATSVRESELISISQVSQERESPLDQLARLMPGTVSADDGLPQFACPACLTKLELCDKTIANFTAADTKLRSLFLSYDIQMAGTDAWDAFPDVPGDDLDAVDASSLAVALRDACPPEDHHLHNACPPKDHHHDSCPPTVPSILDSCLLKDHDLHNTCPLEAHLVDACALKEEDFDAVTPAIAENARDVAQSARDVAERKVELKCPLCHAGFPSETQLASHRWLHDGATPHACPTCGARFVFRAQLRRHVESHDVDRFVMMPGFSAIASTKEMDTRISFESDPLTIPPTISTSLAGITNLSSGLACTECGSVFARRAALRRHERTHRGLSCLCCRCGKVLANAASLKVHQRSHSTERRFPCDACPKAFKDSSALTRHKSTHGQPPPFRCPACARSFPTEALLLRHSAAAHEASAPAAFRCPRCPAAFRRRGNLAAHVAQCERRPFGCATCGKRVRTELTLKYHVSRHTSERLPFGCATCARRFRSAGALRTHLRAHSGERPYGCAKCGERFRSAGTLRQHAARHREDRPFGCAICERRFKRRPSLAVHLRTHTGERPYPCPICQRAFAQHGDLRKHQRTHREMAPPPPLEPFVLGELGELLLLELPAVEVEVP